MISFKEAKELTQNSKYAKAMSFIETHIMHKILEKNYGVDPFDTLNNLTNNITIAIDPSEIDDEMINAIEIIGKGNGYNICHFPSVEREGMIALYISWPVLVPAYNIKKPIDDSGILNVGELAFVTIVKNSVDDILDRLDDNIRIRAKRGYSNSETIYRSSNFTYINSRVASSIIDTIIDTVKRSIDQSFTVSSSLILKEDDSGTCSIASIKFYVSWK